MNSMIYCNVLLLCLYCIDIDIVVGGGSGSADDAAMMHMFFRLSTTECHFIRSVRAPLTFGHRRLPCISWSSEYGSRIEMLLDLLAKHGKATLCLNRFLCIRCINATVPAYSLLTIVQYIQRYRVKRLQQIHKMLMYVLKTNSSIRISIELLS